MRGGPLAIGDRGDDTRDEASPTESRERLAPPDGFDWRDFRAVYDRYFHETKRWLRALGIPASDLDDVAQEVFIVVRRKQNTFDGRNLPGWLFRIAQRTASDHRRRPWFRRWFSTVTAQELERFEWGGPSPAESLERREAQRELNRALAKMSDKLRTAFVLFEVEQYGGDEVAALLGVPPGTAWTRLRHARRIFLEHCAQIAGQHTKENAR